MILRPFGLHVSQAADGWWQLLAREETLGRLVWIVEDTLNSMLLERA